MHLILIAHAHVPDVHICSSSLHHPILSHVSVVLMHTDAGRAQPSTVTTCPLQVHTPPVASVHLSGCRPHRPSSTTQHRGWRRFRAPGEIACPCHYRKDSFQSCFQTSLGVQEEMKAILPSTKINIPS